MKYEEGWLLRNLQNASDTVKSWPKSQQEVLSLQPKKSGKCPTCWNLFIVEHYFLPSFITCPICSTKIFIPEDNIKEKTIKNIKPKRKFIFSGEDDGT